MAWLHRVWASPVGRWGVAIFLALVALGLAFLWGRSSVPEIVRTETVEKVRTQVVYRTKIVTVHSVDRHVQTHTVETRKPDGEVVITRDTSSDTHSKESKESETNKTSKTEKDSVKIVTEDRKKDWRVGGLVGLGLNGTVGYGVEVERRIFGPLYAGAWGLSTGVVGVTVGVEF